VAGVPLLGNKDAADGLGGRRGAVFAGRRSMPVGEWAQRLRAAVVGCVAAGVARER